MLFKGGEQFFIDFPFSFYLTKNDKKDKPNIWKLFKTFNVILLNLKLWTLFEYPKGLLSY